MKNSKNPFTFLKHVKIWTTSHTLEASDCKITYFYPVLLYFGWCNPFNSTSARPFFSTIPAGGFCFMGFRMSWSRDAEIRSLREVISF